MTSDDRKRARAVCDAATNGPWTHGTGYEQSEPGDYVFAGDGTVIVCDDQAPTPDDAEFTAFARTALPQALDEIERLRIALEIIADDDNGSGFASKFARAALGES